MSSLETRVRRWKEAARDRVSAPSEDVEDDDRLETTETEKTRKTLLRQVFNGLVMGIKLLTIVTAVLAGYLGLEYHDQPEQLLTDFLAFCETRDVTVAAIADWKAMTEARSGTWATTKWDAVSATAVSTWNGWWDVISGLGTAVLLALGTAKRAAVTKVGKIAAGWTAWLGAHTLMWGIVLPVARLILTIRQSGGMFFGNHPVMAVVRQAFGSVKAGPRIQA